MGLTNVSIGKTNENTSLFPHISSQNLSTLWKGNINPRNLSKKVSEFLVIQTLLELNDSCSKDGNDDNEVNINDDDDDDNHNNATMMTTAAATMAKAKWCWCWQATFLTRRQIRRRLTLVYVQLDRSNAIKGGGIQSVGLLTHQIIKKSKRIFFLGQWFHLWIEPKKFCIDSSRILDSDCIRGKLEDKFILQQP